MGFLFLIAGYFTPGSYNKKGIKRFIKDRLIRLGLPTLLFMYIVGPITELLVINSTRNTFPNILKFYIDHVVLIIYYVELVHYGLL